MSGLEIAIPVISAVFALVSAFKDGGTIVEKIKERRRRKGARLPNEKLQHAFDLGSEQIQQLREEGIQEFGDAFERDAATASKLKDVTIVLQDAIIRQLAAAHNDDSIDDFNPTISLTIHARKEAVNILNELYMTLDKQRTRRDLAPAATPASLSRSETLIGGPSSFGQLGGFTTSPAPHVNAAVSKSRTGSWIAKLRRPSLESPPPRALQSPCLSPSPDICAAEASQTAPEMRESAPPLSPLSNPRSSTAASPQVRRVSTSLSMLSPPLSPQQISSVTEATNFGGFCKGAWYAQRMLLSKAMESSMRDYEWLYHCRKCKFRLHADQSRRGNPHFDDRMQISGPLYFRLLFLWKSHIETKDAVRRYLCLLCVLGGEKSKLYHSEDHLFEHISRHEGKVYGNTPIVGPIEVTSDGVLPASIGTFDFYIPPRQRPAEPSFMLPESAMAMDHDAIATADNDQRISALFQGDPYENAWSNEGPNAAVLGSNTGHH